MGSRIIATIIVVAGIGALLWVAFADTPEERVSAATGDEPASVEPDVASESHDPTPADQPTESATEQAPEAPATPTPLPALENFGPRMDLVDLDGWLNTDATSIDDFNGKVLLVEMWTFGCHNCKARIPFNQGYYEEFGGENFEIIGVHAPEFSYEAEVPNIIEAAERLGVDWPIALDTTKKNFRSWQPGSTNFWPRTFVVDQNGDIRYDHIGEGKYEELRETIRQLIEHPPAPNSAP